MSSEQWLSVAQVARELGLSKMTIYRMIEGAELPGAVRFGRSYRIHEQSYRTWVAAKLATAAVA